MCTELATFVAKVSLMGPFSPSTAGRCVHVEWECRQEAWVKLNIPRKTVKISLTFDSRLTAQLSIPRQTSVSVWCDSGMGGGGP